MLIPFGVFSAAGAGGGAAAGSYDLISTTILGSSQSSVTFDVSTLASTYKHLQLRIVGRSDRTSTGGDYIRLRFNSDSATNYSVHTLGSNTGATIYSEATSNGNAMQIERISGGDFTSGHFGVMITDILDPFSTTKYKTIKNFGAVTNNNVMLQSGNWRSTSAVTAVNLVIGGGTNFITGSRFSIYGLKG